MSLKLCSLAARGLWIEMLAIMGISEKNGYLQIGGKAITEEQLAVIAGVSIDDIKKYLKELEDNGVFSRDENGIPYCRRMAREYQTFEKAREYGKQGGNPALKSEDHSKNPEAIVQKLEAKGGITGGDNPPLNPILVEFEECWKLYPDKSGKEKAWAAYQKARKNDTTQQDVLSGINRYLAYVRDRQQSDFPDLKYKNGSTWFNQQCWKDEYTILKKAKKIYD